MMKNLFALAFFFAATPLLAICTASKVALVPERPTIHDGVDVRITGACTNACVPSVQLLRITPGSIRLESHTTQACLSVGSPFQLDAYLGRLAAGTYELVLVHDAREAARATISVTASAPSFELLPSFGRQETEVFVRGLADCPGDRCPKTVRFHGVDATAVRPTDGGVVATVPTLPVEGPVDVTVVQVDGSLLTREKSFEYTTRFDPDDYLRVMFATTYAGPGAHGSRWVSENVISSSAPMTISPIGAPPIAPRTTTTLATDDRDRGAVLLLPRGVEELVAFASHIRDTSRAGLNLGTEIPVVLERDTASEVRIVGIPGDPRYRPRLRIYDIDGNELPVVVRVVTANGSTLANATLVPRRSFVCVTTPCEDVAFVSYDFPVSVPSLQDGSLVEVVVSGEKNRRLWAFVSLTNNETQQVTTYSP